MSACVRAVDVLGRLEAGSGKSVGDDGADLGRGVDVRSSLGNSWLLTFGVRVCWLESSWFGWIEFGGDVGAERGCGEEISS